MREAVSYEVQRRVYQQLRAEPQLVDEAAAGLRHRAILDGYTGLQSKHVAFALAVVLDELGRQLRNIDEEVRAATLDCCRRCSGSCA